MEPQFVCLSMLVKGTRADMSVVATMRDCLAYAIEYENDPRDLPPLVERSVEMLQQDYWRLRWPPATPQEPPA